MINTTHLLNRGGKRYVDKGGFQKACEEIGLDPHEVIAACKRATGANLFMWGIEVGKLLCDPRTHIE